MVFLCSRTYSGNIFGISFTHCKYMCWNLMKYIQTSYTVYLYIYIYICIHIYIYYYVLGSNFPQSLENCMVRITQDVVASGYAPPLSLNGPENAVDGNETTVWMSQCCPATCRRPGRALGLIGNHGLMMISYPMTDPAGAAIYGAPWIPSLYTLWLCQNSYWKWP